MAFDLKQYRDQNRDRYGNADLETVAKDIYFNQGFVNDFSSPREFMQASGLDKQIARYRERQPQRSRQDDSDQGYLETAAKGVARGVEGIAGGIGSATRWAGEATGQDWLAGLGETASDYWEKAAREGWEAQDPEIYQGEFLENPSVKRAVGTIAQALPSLAAGFTASVATGNPWIGAGALGLLEGAPQYEESRESGKGVGYSSVIGGASTVGTALLEYLPISRMLGRTGGIFRGIVKGGAEEAMQESTQTLWQNLIAKYGYDETRKLAEGLVESAIAGAGTGAAVGGAASKLNEATREMDPDEVQAATDSIKKQLTTLAGDIQENPEAFNQVTPSALFGLATESQTPYQRKRLMRRLNSEDPRQRQKASEEIRGKLQEEGKGVAQAWDELVAPRIGKDQPINFNESVAQMAERKKQDDRAQAYTPPEDLEKESSPEKLITDGREGLSPEDLLSEDDVDVVSDEKIDQALGQQAGQKEGQKSPGESQEPAPEGGLQGQQTGQQTGQMDIIEQQVFGSKKEAQKTANQMTKQGIASEPYQTEEGWMVRPKKQEPKKGPKKSKKVQQEVVKSEGQVEPGKQAWAQDRAGEGEYDSRDAAIDEAVRLTREGKPHTIRAIKSQGKNKWSVVPNKKAPRFTPQQQKKRPKQEIKEEVAEQEIVRAEGQVEPGKQEWAQDKYTPLEDVYQDQKAAQKEANRLTKEGKPHKITQTDQGWILQPMGKKQEKTRESDKSQQEPDKTPDEPLLGDPEFDQFLKDIRDKGAARYHGAGVKILGRKQDGRGVYDVQITENGKRRIFGSYSGLYDARKASVRALDDIGKGKEKEGQTEGEGPTRESWEMTQEEFASTGTPPVFDDRKAETHKSFVKAAIEEGKEVPWTVLEDYPDLKKKSKEPKTEEPNTEGMSPELAYRTKYRHWLQKGKQGEEPKVPGHLTAQVLDNIQKQEERSLAEEHQSPQNRLADWRENLMKARQVAKDLGLETKGKKLDQLVAEIDRVDAGETAGTKTQSEPTTFSQGDRVYIPKRDRHGEVVNAETMRMSDAMSGDTVRSYQMVTVKTDNGVEETMSSDELQSEQETPEKVVPDVWDTSENTYHTPEQALRMLESMRQSEKNVRQRAVRARKPENINSLNQRADALKERADNLTKDIQKWANNNIKAAQDKGVLRDLSVVNEPGSQTEKYDAPISYHETRHAKRDIPLYVVRLDKRVDRDIYNKLNAEAKKRGGWYSRYKQRGAVPGFQFTEKEKAQEFAQLFKNPPKELQGEDKTEGGGDWLKNLSDAFYDQAKDKMEETKEDQQAQEETTTKPEYGANNKVVTKERYNELSEKLRKKLGGQLNVGFDPEIATIGMEMAAYHIEAGARKFKDFATAMVNQFGDGIKPYLKGFYKGGKMMPGMEEYAKDMSQDSEVDAFDLDAIQQEGSHDRPNADATDRPAGGTGAEALGETQAGDGQSPQGTGGTGRGASGGRGDSNGGNAGSGRGSSAATPSQENQQLSGSHTDAHGDSQSVSGDSSSEVYPPTGRRGTDFHISGELESSLGSGGAITRARNNIEAIKVLKELEESGRNPTETEQAKLVQYIGWGGLPEFFNNTFVPSEYGDKRKSVSEIKKELQNVLTREEYAAARASTQNAHYTSPEVIHKMWDAMSHFGFKGGRVLEPGSGIGLFYTMMPETMFNQSQYTGIERDQISGRIAKQLYPKSHIKVDGFENVALPDEFYDVAVSNVPFANVKPYDPSGRYKKKNLALHDFFFAKSLDKVRPGGIVAFITSRYTMDRQDPKVRQYLQSKADLLGAIRLPNTAFKKFANTEVTTDIVILRKRGPEAEPQGQAWENVAELKEVKHPETGESMLVNEYFVQNPDMMLGNMGFTGTMYTANEPTLEPGSKPLDQALQEAIGRLPEGALQERPKQEKNIDELYEKNVPAPEDLKEGNYTIHEGAVAVKQNGVLRKATVNKKDAERIKDIIPIRDAMRNVFRTQRLNAKEEKVVQAREELNRVYDDFVRKHGPLNKRANRNAFKKDTDSPALLSLEKYDPDTGEAEKRDIFSKRTIHTPEPVEHVDDPQSALKVSLNEYGRVNLQHMASISDYTEEQLISELQDTLFKNPETEQWETRDIYLSGNVKHKLKVAREAAAVDPQYEKNVKELEPVQPKDLTIQDIRIKLGVPWMPNDIIEDFVSDLLEVGLARRKMVNVIKDPTNAIWKLSVPKLVRDSVNSRSTWGVDRKNGTADKLIEAALNQQTPTMKSYDREKDTMVVDPELTERAQSLQEKIQKQFNKWIMDNPGHLGRILEIYNESYNTDIERQYDGSHLDLPGSNPNVQLRPSQKNAIWRIIQDGGGLLHHVVGAGKTWTMVGAGMEMRRLGLVKKPLYVVPNHMIEQFPKEFLELYPTANILSLGTKDLKKEQRRITSSKIATGEWDGVIIPYSAFEKIAVSPEYETEFIQEQIEELEWAISNIQDEEGESMKGKSMVKRLENVKDKKEARLKDLANRKDKDQQVTFEELGVDFMFVDEAHNFKNLEFQTKIKATGIGNRNDVQKSLNMLMKTRYLQSLHGGDKGVTFATGTPVSNSIAEMYLMMRYLIPHELESRGLTHFDSWAGNFADVQTDWEWDIDNSGYTERSRFRKFVNVGELITLYRKFADIIQSKDLPNIKVPEVKGGAPELITVKPTDQLLELNRWCSSRLQAWKKKPNHENREGNPLNITTIGRKAAVDLRLIDPEYPDDPNNKLNVAIGNVHDIWERTKEDKATQLVWLDQGVPGGKTINLYEDMREKLVARGVPREEIAFIHEYDGKGQNNMKEVLFHKVRNGDIRVLIGSTSKMGEGMNVQNRLIAAHHIDPTWKPAQMEQRDGRIIRQGNSHDMVEIYRYSTERSFDAFFWQTLETKATYIGQILSATRDMREIEDIDEVRASYAEAMAVTSGSPLLKERLEAEQKLQKLYNLKNAHASEQAKSQARINSKKRAMDELEEKKRAVNYHLDRAQDLTGDNFKMTVDGTEYTDRQEAREGIKKLLEDFGQDQSDSRKRHAAISLGGYDISLAKEKRFFETEEGKDYRINAHIALDYMPDIVISDFDEYSDPIRALSGNVSRKAFQKKLHDIEDKYKQHQEDIESLQKEAERPFDKQKELEEAQQRLDDIYEQLERESGKGGGQQQGSDDSDVQFKAPIKGTKRGLQAKNVREYLDRTMGQHLSQEAKDRIHVVQSVAQLPKPVLGEVMETRGMKQTPAAFWNGHIYMVADNLPNLGSAISLSLTHELTHMGFDNVRQGFSERFGGDVAKAGRKVDKVLSEVAVRFRSEIRAMEQDAYAGVYQDMPYEKRMRRMAEEFLAENPEMFGEGRWYDRYMAAVAKFIREVAKALGVNLNIANAEIRDMLETAYQTNRMSSARRQALVQEGGLMPQEQPLFQSQKNFASPNTFDRSNAMTPKRGPGKHSAKYPPQPGSGAGIPTIKNKNSSTGAIYRFDNVRQLIDGLIRLGTKGVFIRWSRGPAYDQKQKYSVDKVSGQKEEGLSAIQVEKEWLEEPWYLVRRLKEYAYGTRLNDPNIRGWMYAGKKLGEDSDGYDAIEIQDTLGVIGKRFLDDIDNGLARFLELQDSIEKDESKLKRLTDKSAIKLTQESLDKNKKEIEKYKERFKDYPLPKLTGLPSEGGTADIRFRRTSTKPIDTSNILSDEVRKRVQDASGARADTLWEKAKNKALEVFEERKSPVEKYLDKTQDAQLIENLRQHRGHPRYAHQKAYDAIRDFLKPIQKYGDQGKEVFTMNLLLDDMLKDMEPQADTGKPLLDPADGLPFGFQSYEEVKQARDQYRELARQYPEIREAIDNRNRYMQDLKKRLVQAKILRKEALNDPSYFHHQVLEYLNVKNGRPAGATGSKDVRNHWRGWMAGRKGTAKDYNTEYAEAEFEVISEGIQQYETWKTLQKVKRDYDMLPKLRDQAKEENLNNLWDKLEKEGRLEQDEMGQWKDPLAPHKQKIAVGFTNLGKLAADGELEYSSEWEHVVQDLIEEQARRKDHDASQFQAPITNPDVLNFLNYLLDKNKPGAKWAATVFKGIKERNQFIKNELGNDFLDWKAILKRDFPDHTTWRPKAGTSWYQTFSIADRLIDQMMEKGKGEFTAKDLQEVKAIIPGEQWVIPDRVATQLDHFKTPMDEGPIGRASGRMLSAWKQWILLNPYRLIKYNLNNVSGDLDIATAYAPEIWSNKKFALQAARDLAKWHRGGEMSHALKKEMDEVLYRDVIDSGLTIYEIEDLTEAIANDKYLRDLVGGRKETVLKRGISKYWNGVKNFTRWRENVLRLAAYRFFKEKWEQGHKLYGASNPQMIDQLKTVDDKAARLARELVGDYGNISEAGEWMRKRLIPFWSWCVPEYTEILTREGWKRYEELKVGEEALTYNMETRQTEWQKVEDKAAYPFDGNLVTIQNSHGFKYQFTDDHRVVVIEKYKDKRKIVKAKDLKTHHHLPLVAPHSFTENSLLTEKEAGLLGWLVTDGYCRSRKHAPNSFEAMIYQKKPEMVEKIRKTFAEYISSESVHPDTNTICFRLKAASLDNIRKHYRTKEDLPKIVTKLGKAACEAMYEAMMDAEGTKVHRFEAFPQQNGPVLDAFQILCYMLGKAGQIRKKNCNNVGFNPQGRKNHHSLYVKQGDKVQLYKWQRTREHYSGYVWCPKTPNGTWIMRQNGKVMITGNCEINAPRYVKLFRNLKDEGRTSRAAGTMAWKGTKLALKASALYAMVHLFNHLVHPDEEDELREYQRRQMHLILGRREDGSIISIRFQGALSDALSWFAAEDLPEDIEDLTKGQATVQGKLAEAAKAGPTKLFHGLRPEPKMLYESTTGRTLYPDPWSGGRPIRDVTEHILRTFSLDSIYNKAVGKPQKGGGGWQQWFVNDLKNLVTYETAPGEAAYYNVKKKMYDYLDEKGIERPSPNPTNRSNALYYYRQALKYGDIPAAAKYKKKYFELGGTHRGLQSSVKRAHPLAGLPKRLRYDFRRSLSPEEEQTLRRAIAWYRQTYQGRGY